jgi:hypothetical protein
MKLLTDNAMALRFLFKSYFSYFYLFSWPKSPFTRRFFLQPVYFSCVYKISALCNQQPK